jgi:hypothetical protein
MGGRAFVIQKGRGGVQGVLWMGAKQEACGRPEEGYGFSQSVHSCRFFRTLFISWVKHLHSTNYSDAYGEREKKELNCMNGERV